MAMVKRVAFLGLGVMGYPMAGWLAKNGHAVVVYNRTEAVAEHWCRDYTSGESAVTPRLAVKDADIVISCVGNDDDMRDIMLGDQGVLSDPLCGLKVGAIIVDHTTTSAELAKELAEVAAEKHFGFVDAPVSGGQQGAETGQLTIMCGGLQEHFDVASVVMQGYAKSLQLMGDVGSGQLCKMVNQICIAGIIQGLAEGLNFAKRAGLDAQQVVEVISKGAAQSWQMDNRHQTMLADQYEHGFAVQWMRKDLAFALQEAEANGSDLPIAKLVDSYYAEIQTMGGDRWDTSSLLARLER